MDQNAAEEAAKDYLSSLADLNVNSKPLINMLTILAEDNIDNAAAIVNAIESHLAKVQPDVKLPILYLIDSIVKNVGKEYKTLFSQCIVTMFCGVFEKVNEKVREKMFSLRQTWNDVFPQTKLYTLDVKINCIDPGWPITAKVTTKSPAIHVNPNFFKNKAAAVEPISEMQQQLRNKQRELLELQAKKLELELVATKKRIEEQEKQINIQTNSISKETSQDPVLNKATEIMKIAEGRGLGSSTIPPAKNRIAPVNAGLISLAKSRDPRLARQQQNQAKPKTDLPPMSSFMKERIPRLSNRTTDGSAQNKKKPSTMTSSHAQKGENNKLKGRKEESLGFSREKDGSKGNTGRSSGNSTRSSTSDKKKSPSESPSKAASKKKRDLSDSKLSPKTGEHTSPSKSSSKFKDVKSYKNKNYMRRNREPSKSPEKAAAPVPTPPTADVDLRVIIPDKKMQVDDVAQLKQNNENETNNKLNSNEQKTISASKDIDLRIVPPINESASTGLSSPLKEAIVKKRPSNSNSKIDEPIPKKTKSEKIDLLFGNEDVDLRTMQANALALGAADVLTPPPPPIISNKLEDKLRNTNISAERSKKSNLEAVRAKFAEATKKDKDKLGRPLLYNKLPDDPVERKRTISNTKPTDVDLRQREPPTYDENSQEGIATNIKIIMAQAQEQLDNENIDAGQYKTLVNQVIHMSEAQKIREAQRIESKSKNAVEDMIGVEEDSVGFSPASDDSDTTKSKPESVASAKKDETKSTQHSTFATVTAADLRNMQSSSRDPRRPRESKWNRPEPTPVVTNPNWNQRNVNPTPLPFVNRGLPNPWEQSPFQSTPKFPQQVLIHGGIIPGITKSTENMRTINIDGIAREIRFYEDTAIIFMSWDEPKEIGFQMGQRRVIVDDKENFDLCFNDDYKSITIDAKVYQMKFGSPTRELYIDNIWYECYFGDPPLSILLDGKQRVFKIGGPAPQVKIGNSRVDLVAGKINMIINAEVIIPVFLDAKIQTFEIQGQTHTLQFADYLLTVIINDEPFLVEYGGLPKLYRLRGKDYYIRFTAAPKLIVPGKVYIKNMVRTHLYEDLQTPPEDPNCMATLPFVPNVVPAPGVLAPSIVPVIPTQPVTTTGLDYLTNLIPHTTQSNLSNNTTGYQIEAGEIPIAPPTPTPTPVALNIPALNHINIDELYKKIVECGILNKKTAEVDIEKKHDLVPVLLSRPETIKKRQSAIVDQLFSGMQCSSCGVRFPPEQTMKYSQHLDWHFRQNRRDRDSARRAHSRKWYYDVSDWIQYEEIEDLEEREKNWFETQQTEQLEFNGDDNNQKVTETPPQSCPAGTEDSDKHCDMCHDNFEQFYNEENEEWHLKSAIRVDGQTYHPLCYEDYKVSLTLDESAMNVIAMEIDESVVEIKIKEEIVEDAPDVIDVSMGDDDDVIALPAEEPIVTEILDDDDDIESEALLPMIVKVLDEEKKEEEKTDESTENKTESVTADVAEAEDKDDDVQIQEPNIEITDLDLIEDKPVDDLNTMDETSQMSQSSLRLVKIKDEPKDDSYNEEDAFEDVGTVEPPLEDLENEKDDIEYVASPTVDTTHSDMIASIDGNVELQDNPGTATTNRIKINISNKAIISNYNENSSDSNNINNIHNNNNELNDDEDSNNKDILGENEILDIDYVLKEGLEDVEFSKMKPARNGIETSGLCSIM